MDGSSREDAIRAQLTPITGPECALLGRLILVAEREPAPISRCGRPGRPGPAR